MSEFNGGKFYGFSLYNDPALSTTTRNFEFRYNRPDQLDRTIRKVQLTDVRQKKNLLPNLSTNSKPKRPSEVCAEEGTSYQTRDADIETHVSTLLPTSRGDRDTNRIRALSENEVEQLIGKAKSFMELSDINDKAERREESKLFETQTHDVYCHNQHLTKGHFEKVIVEEYRCPQAKWVEVQERSPTGVQSVGEVKKPERIRSKETFTLRSISPTPHEAERIMALFKKQPTIVPPTIEYEDVPNERADMAETVEDDSMYFVEDSDLEYEMIGREEYTKYCNPRPKEEELLNLSHESGGYAKFVEIEPEIPCMDLSFLKNVAPIRYTDMTDEQLDEQIMENPQMKVFIKGLKHDEQEYATTEHKEPKKKSDKDTKKKPLKSRHSQSSVSKSTTISPRAKYTKLSNDSPTIQRSPRSPLPRSKQVTPRGMAKETRRINKMLMSKSIEDLKLEKKAIFVKMTATQERIVDVLDKLRISLLEIYVPDSGGEKNRRQKNAFEFTVRFSRNFLYPLKGMIDNLKCIPVEQLNSASSNDACGRVAAIYTLLQQSLQTYLKQLRFFLLDQVPQKLTPLIEMTYSVTSICLEKGIFDRHDPIIDCLQDRCTKFSEFLENLHEERFFTARDNYRKMNFEKSSKLGYSKNQSHNNYDLKMFMNDLNMYEPKLVPKYPTYRKKQPRKSVRTNNLATSASNDSISKDGNRNNKSLKSKKQQQQHSPKLHEHSSKMVLSKAAEDGITTQIQAIGNASSSGIHMFSSSNDNTSMAAKILERRQPSLNRVIVEALQTVTKEQVRQVLDPIMQTLETALDKKKNEATPYNVPLPHGNPYQVRSKHF